MANKEEITLSSTHIDSHGMRMTRGVLANIAKQSKGARAIGMGVEHDVTLPPAGKLLSSYIRPTQDGEFALIGKREIMETVEEIVMPDGRKFLRQACPSDPRPFKSGQEEPSEKTKIAVDPMNFGGYNQGSIDKFFDTLEMGPTVERSPDLLRKSLVPDAEMVITFGSAVVTWLNSHKLLDTTTKVIDEDIASAYKTISQAIINFAKQANPKKRPKTYVIIVPGTPTIEFIARTHNPSSVLSAIQLPNLQSHVEESNELSALYAAEKVQFLLQKDGTWAVSFMLTTNGEVIGDEHVIRRRDKVLQAMIDRSPK